MKAQLETQDGLADMVSLFVEYVRATASKFSHGYNYLTMSFSLEIPL